MKISRRKSNDENQSDNGIINSWLAEHGDGAIDRLVKKNLTIATKIQEILTTNQLKAVELADLMNKQKSEVSKWLSGQHTFTMRTITAIENALNCDIVHVEPKVSNAYLTLYVRHESMSKVEDDYVFEDSVYTGEFFNQQI